MKYALALSLTILLFGCNPEPVTNKGDCSDATLPSFVNSVQSSVITSRSSHSIYPLEMYVNFYLSISGIASSDVVSGFIEYPDGASSDGKIRFIEENSEFYLILVADFAHFEDSAASVIPGGNYCLTVNTSDGTSHHVRTALEAPNGSFVQTTEAIKRFGETNLDTNIAFESLESAILSNLVVDSSKETVSFDMTISDTRATRYKVYLLEDMVWQAEYEELSPQAISVDGLNHSYTIDFSDFEAYETGADFSNANGIRVTLYDAPNTTSGDLNFIPEIFSFSEQLDL